MYVLNKTRAAIAPYSSLHPDTIRYRDAIALNYGTISDTDLNTINNFVLAAYANGWQSYLNDCSPLAGDNINAAVVKLWYPNGISNKLTFNPNLPLTPIKGYSRSGGLQPLANNGGSCYADTGWIPSEQGMTTSGGHLSFYSLSTLLDSGADIIAADDATHVFHLQLGSGANGYAAMFHDTANYHQWTLANYPQTKFFTSDRLSDTLWKVRRENVLISTINAVSGSVPVSSVKLFGNAYYTATYGGGTSRACGFYSVGALGIPDSMQASFNSAVQTLMQAFGRA